MAAGGQGPGGGSAAGHGREVRALERCARSCSASLLASWPCLRDAAHNGLNHREDCLCKVSSRTAPPGSTRLQGAAGPGRLAAGRAGRAPRRGHRLVLCLWLQHGQERVLGAAHGQARRVVRGGAARWLGCAGGAPLDGGVEPVEGLGALLERAACYCTFPGARRSSQKGT